MDLNEIKDPSFLKELDIRQLNQLAQDIRYFLINNISKTRSEERRVGKEC